jgi:cation-transporting ATPase 13A1
LTAVGVVPNNNRGETKIQTLVPMIQATPLTSIILGGCHSLISIDGKISGDPVEEAAIHSIGWTYDPLRDASYPKIGYVQL